MTLLPGLVYVGDVPVEASYHGSALLYRLLSDYPAEKLTIIETATESQTQRRLPKVNYINHPIGKPRWLNTRFHPYAVAWFTHAAPRTATKIAQSVDSFESVLTVAHGFGWLAAAEIASQRNVPLHLIIHDDWPRVADVAPRISQLARRTIRAGVSPGAIALSVCRLRMSRFYEERYGAPASVIYPSRAAACPDYDEPPAHLASNDKPFTIVFAGTINSNGYIEALVAVQNALKLS